jgi:Domain of unknown function (DUF4388)
MTEFSGTLDGIGLFALLNFLSGLQARGRLAITDREQNGTLFLSGGHVVGASFGSDTGEVALDAIGLALGQGRFNFTDDGAEQPTNLSMGPAELQKHLENLAAERQRIMAVIPSLDAAPSASLDALEEGADDQPVTLDRGTLRLLMRSDGQRSVLDLAREGGLLLTLKRLANLNDLKLISVADHPPRAPAALSEETIVLTRPTSMAESPAPASAPTAPEPARAPAESANHPRRPWWQGEGP